MNSKHTPGPWQTYTQLGHTQLYGSPVPRYGIGTIHTKDTEGKANLRLIAKAPDMVKCIEELSTAVDALFEHCCMVHKHWGDGCNQKEADAAIEATRTALERAKEYRP